MSDTTGGASILARDCSGVRPLYVPTINMDARMSLYFVAYSVALIAFQTKITYAFSI